MPVRRIVDPADARLADYRGVSDPELLRRGEIFVAEGRQVVRVLLSQSTYRTRSLALTETAFRALGDVIEPRLPDIELFIVEPGVIEQLSGYNIHRGCLAIGERPARIGLPALLASNPSARRLLVLDRVGNADNVGAIFRNAAAFGCAGVILGHGCCDQLYRKAVRVSMGAVLRVPFAWAGLPEAIDASSAAGMTVVALTPRPGAEDISAFARRAPLRLALLLGAEGDGLSEEAMELADAWVRIPVAPGVDSLNVATAAGIALYALSGKEDEKGVGSA